jgi:hypothetical protein
VLLHDAEELDNDLRGWSDQDLSLSGLLGVVDGIERIVLNPESSQHCSESGFEDRATISRAVYLQMERKLCSEGNVVTTYQD